MCFRDDTAGSCLLVRPYHWRVNTVRELGLPVAALATGAEGIKTLDQRTRFGGLAKTAYDPCYHQFCDSLENVNQEVLEQMTQALASVVEQLAEKKDLRQFLNLELPLPKSSSNIYSRQVPSPKGHRFQLI